MWSFTMRASETWQTHPQHRQTSPSLSSSESTCFIDSLQQTCLGTPLPLVDYAHDDSLCKEKARRAVQRGDGPQQCAAGALQHSRGCTTDPSCGTLSVSLTMTKGSLSYFEAYAYRASKWTRLLSELLRDDISCDMCHALSRGRLAGQQPATASTRSRPALTPSSRCGAKSRILVGAGHPEIYCTPEHHTVRSDHITSLPAGCSQCSLTRTFVDEQMILLLQQCDISCAHLAMKTKSRISHDSFLQMARHATPS